MDAEGAWSGLLEPGETILWQGQPDTRISWGDMVGSQSLFGAIFTGFSVFWVAAAASMIGPAGFPFVLFPLFGLPFLAIGLYLLVGHVIADAYFRRNTYYTLTNRTAFIATKRFGRRALTSHPIADMPFLELEDGIPGSVLFGERVSVRARQHPARQRGPKHTIVTRDAIGFRRIAEARQVYRMLRDARGALNFAGRQARERA